MNFIIIILAEKQDKPILQTCNSYREMYIYLRVYLSKYIDFLEEEQEPQYTYTKDHVNNLLIKFRRSLTPQHKIFIYNQYATELFNQ